LVDSATGAPIARAEQPSVAKAASAIWSTDATPERERFSYWRDAVCRAVFNISIEDPPERFSARMSARTSGPIRLATSTSTGSYRLVRNGRDIASAPADHYSIFMQLSGRTVIKHGDDETTALYADDIAIYDGRLPFRAEIFDGGRTMAVIPRAMIDRRAPWLKRRPVQKFNANSRFVDLARRHLLELIADDSTLSETTTSMLTDNLCNLLALASATDVAPNRLPPELQIEALLAFCRQSLHDVELSPQFVADHFGISVRTLHLRFNQIGYTFGRWVLENRLEACRTALHDQNQRALNISEIAYRWGFNDLSYFNKAFRARFNETPRDWRNSPDLRVLLTRP
jgi:AraC family transcriptional regulator, positive regulator of tynA and feaB